MNPKQHRYDVTEANKHRQRTASLKNDEHIRTKRTTGDIRCYKWRLFFGDKPGELLIKPWQMENKEAVSMQVKPEQENVTRIKPNDQWCWYFDKQHDRMMLDLSNGVLFRSRFPGKMLIADAFWNTTFSVDDATLYYAFSESCSALNLNAPQTAELALNALAALRFLKPQMPKSWYFAKQNTAWHPADTDIVSVWLVDSLQPVSLLIVETTQAASLCMITQPELDLSGRIMHAGDAIKIMNDRLSPFTQWQQQKHLDRVV